jgi:hypothetical protein
VKSCYLIKAVFYCIGLTLAFGGCSTSATNPVSGKVVYTDGSPATDLVGHTVSFDCAEHKVGASGEIQADGTFRLGTFEDNDGAMAGMHRVAISAPLPPVDAPAPLLVIDKKYGDMSTSGLEVEIKPGPNDVTLTLERKKR